MGFELMRQWLRILTHFSAKCWRQNVFTPSIAYGCASVR